MNSAAVLSARIDPAAPPDDLDFTVDEFLQAGLLTSLPNDAIASQNSFAHPATPEADPDGESGPYTGEKRSFGANNAQMQRSKRPEPLHQLKQRSAVDLAADRADKKQVNREHQRRYRQRQKALRYARAHFPFA